MLALGILRRAEQSSPLVMAVPGYLGGTLVMYGPGRLMTCGGLHDVPWHEP